MCFHLAKLCLVRVTTNERSIFRLWELLGVHHHLALWNWHQAVLQNNCPQN